MSFEEHIRDLATQTVGVDGEPVGVGPDPDGPYYCEVQRDEHGVGVSWTLRDEDAVAHRWIVSTVGVGLAEMR